MILETRREKYENFCLQLHENLMRAEFFQKFSKEYGVELGICKDAPTLENAHLAEGYEYLSIITTKIDAQLVERFHELGVK